MCVTLGVSTRLDRGRQMVVEAGLRRAVVCAEAQHDALLVGQDPVEAARQPQHDNDGNDEPDPGRAAEPARQEAPEAVLAAPQNFFEIGRLRSARAAGAAAASRRPGRCPRGCRRPPPRGPAPQGPPPSLFQIIENPFSAAAIALRGNVLASLPGAARGRQDADGRP